MNGPSRDRHAPPPPSKPKDLYELLGVPRTAEAEEIKKAYRTLAKKLHPDRNPGDKVSEEKFKEVSAAFAVLGDAPKRALYDEFGPDGLREGFDADSARNYKRWAQTTGGRGGMPGGDPGGGGGFGGFGDFGDMQDILGSLFGAAARARGSHQRRGADAEAEATISLRDALSGTEIHFEGMESRIRIPAGVSDGQRIRVAGQGGHGAAGRGDLLVKIHVAVPMGFRTEGEDLEIDLPLTVSQAVLGATVPVPTPEGTTVQLKVPAGTQSGQRLRLRGKGLPRKGGERSDLFAKALVRVPRGDDPRLAELVRELEQFYV